MAAPSVPSPRASRVATLVLAGLAAGFLSTPPASAVTPDETVRQRLAALRDYGWKVERVSHGVRVLTRMTPGSPVREVRALSVSAAPPERLMEVVTAYADYPAFVPYVVESEVLPSPDGVTRVFQHLDFGPPIKDRAYTIRMIPFRSPHDGSRGLTWALENAPEFQRETSSVRPPVNEGSWQFTPLGDGASTMVEYMIRSDPGGWIPNWASAIALRRSVPSVVGAVSKRAVEGP